MVKFPTIAMKKSVSRTELETKTPEQIAQEYGDQGLILCILKSLKRHDSDRNLRRQLRVEKKLQKKRGRR